MLTKCTILTVEKREHKGKTVADVVLLLTDPTEAYTVTLWNNSILDGHHTAYEKLIAQEALVPLQFDIFNGKLQCRLFTSVQPQAVKPPAAKVA
tara:strand:+ start:92450 stop:92731 length:282 start_codon:yes stop_codon:yes gene_type:complete